MYFGLLIIRDPLLPPSKNRLWILSYILIFITNKTIYITNLKLKQYLKNDLYFLEF